MRLPQAVVGQQTMPPDCNSIHNEKYSNRNFVNWHFEGEAEEDCHDDVGLLQKIKMIKAAAAAVESGITFQDVLCASLSVTLYQHFSKTKSNLFTAAEEITIGNAVQQQLKQGESRKLTNSCAYNFERIPIRPPAAAKGDLVAVLKEIRRRRAEVSKLQESNYLMIRFCSLLPDRYLRRLLAKNRCSLGISNIPGPTTNTLGGGGTDFLMKHWSFWTPNRFKTRLGLSVFTLQNKMHFGIGGDCCSFDNFEDSGQILKGIVTELNRMYKIMKP